jgi:ATP-dependent protease ClpP protease subunit
MGQLLKSTTLEEREKAQVRLFIDSVQRDSGTSYKYARLYLIDELGEAPIYINTIDKLRTLTSADVIEVIITSYGGMLDTMTLLRASLLSTGAKIIVNVPNVAMSAATMFFDIADEVIINAQATVMIHEYSAGIVGKGQELKAQQEFYARTSRILSDTVYKDFLTDEEINNIHRGEDLYFTGKEWADRIDAIGKKVTVVGK